MAWGLYRLFTAVSLEVMQVSCAQLMSKFVPGDLVAKSVVMARCSVIKSTCQCAW